MTGQRAIARRNQGQIIARGERVWLVRIYVGRDGARRKKYSSRTVHGTYKQAEQEVTKMLAEQNAGTFVQPSKQLLRDYLTAWIAEDKQNLRETTRQAYEQIVTARLIPAFEMLRLDQLTHYHVQHYINGTSLSPGTIRLTHMVLQQALERAVTLGLLAKNPCAHVVLPSKPKTEKTILTPAQVCLLLEKTQGSHYYPLWHTLLTTGVRPGEAFALRWDDYDGASLTVRHTLQRRARRDQPGVLSPPKTTSGTRRIPLGASTIAVLEQHRKQQAKAILLAGPAYHRDQFIFAAPDGRPLFAASVQHQWKRTMKALGLPAIRLYHERHTHLSHLLASGEDIKAVSMRAGHASVQITMDTYYTVLPAKHEELAKKTDEILFGKAHSVKEA